VLKRSLIVLSAFAALGLPGLPFAEIPPALGPVEGKVIWVDFWASWCVPCRRSFPWMNEMQGRYAGRGLQIIGVNVDKERALADAFVAEVPADFDLRYDPAGALAERFDIVAMPSSFLIDADGKVVATHYGFRTEDTDDYEAAIVTALEAASAGQSE
jgi:thiol-disulfide isomerase/thioredoxin